MVRIESEKVARSVLESIISGEEHERGGIRCFRDDVSHHHFHFFDALARRLGLGIKVSARRLFCLHVS